MKGTVVIKRGSVPTGMLLAVCPGAVGGTGEPLVKLPCKNYIILYFVLKDCQVFSVGHDVLCSPVKMQRFHHNCPPAKLSQQCQC